MKTQMLNLASAFGDRWSLILRSSLYFLLGFLPILYVGFSKWGKKEEVPNGWLIAALFIMAFYQGFIALRAYLDGSAQRYQDQAQARRSGSGAGSFDTAQFIRQPAVPSVPAVQAQQSPPAQTPAG